LRIPQTGENLSYKIDLMEISCLWNLRYLARICNFQKVQITNGNGKFSGLLEIEQAVFVSSKPQESNTIYCDFEKKRQGHDDPDFGFIWEILTTDF
jgi:hypothetical protein